MASITFMAAKDRTISTALVGTVVLGLALMLPALFDGFVLTQVLAIMGGLLVVSGLLTLAFVLARRSERRI